MSLKPSSAALKMMFIGSVAALVSGNAASVVKAAAIARTAVFSIARVALYYGQLAIWNIRI